MINSFKLKLFKIWQTFKVSIPTWLVVILALVLFLRIPSFFEPYSYGDETIYLTLGEGVRQGKILYKDVHDNKPPLLYFTAALAGNLFWFKAFLAFWSLATIVIFWKLTIALFPKRRFIQKVATLIFALLTTLPLFEGNIANAENFMIGFTLLGFLTLLTKELNFRNLFTAGIFFSIATLFKVPAAFDVFAIVFYWLITGGINFKNIKNVTKQTLILFLGFVFPILLTFIWYGLRGTFSEYLTSGFLQNFGYLSSFRPDDVQKSFLEKNTPLIIRGLVVLFGSLSLYPFRKKLSKEFIFITCWLLFTLFAATLSERPYPHYLLQIVSPVTLLFAIVFAMPSLEQSLAILPLTLAFIVPVYYNFWNYSTRDYYERFINFAAGTWGKEEYLARFGLHVPKAYKIAQIINSLTTKNDPVFVWGPESQTVYALSRRFPPIKYVAQYHIHDFANISEVNETIRKTMPKIIVLLPESPRNADLDLIIREKYILIHDIDGALIFLRDSKNIKGVSHLY